MPSTPKRGGKITDSHGTMTETSGEVVSLATKLPSVTKISLGEIRHVTGGRRDIKFLPISGGIKVVVRGNGAIHHIYIYTKTPKEVVGYINSNFKISP